MRDDVYLLYLVFRTLDDLVDDGRPEAAERVAAVEAWAAGDAVAPARPRSRSSTISPRVTRFRATRCGLLRRACARTSTGRSTRPRPDVDRYCYRVAGTVGVVMASVLGTPTAWSAREPAAAALGMAMQRTNILRDIDEDAANGRVYIAREALAALRRRSRPAAASALLRDQIAARRRAL